MKQQTRSLAAPRASLRMARVATATLATLAFFAFLLHASPARAQARQASPEAEQLFRDARQLIKEGKLAEACAALEASDKAEHRLSTLLNLADCYERAQRYASAWALFLAVESEARKTAGEEKHIATAHRRAVALEGRLSYLTINVPDESRVEGLLVTRDGVEIDSAQWNRAVPVDSGSHVVSGKAPGHESWSTTVQVAAEGAQRSVEVPKFKELPKLVVPDEGSLRARRATSNLSAGDEASLEQRDQGPEPSPFTPRRKIALGVAGGSVALAGVAIGFGLASSNARSEALDLCPAASCTADEAARAQDQNDRARRHALFANVGFAVAGGAAITAAVLWFTAAPERRSRATVSLTPLVGASSGLAVTGGF
jgi:hypothetical protein